MERTFRIGQGLDVHAFAPGRSLVLGGVTVPFHLGLVGHSDADVVLHAVIDSILGAVGGGDIGKRFPNSSSEWKDARSTDLLRIVWGEVSVGGWRIENIDVSLLLEAPILAPYIPQMRDCIAEVLGCLPNQIALKATTAERLGFIGRGEGVLASAVALVSRED